MDESRIHASGGRHRFGLFEFDAGALELSRQGRPVSVRLQPLRLLALLLSHRGELVSREELQRALWDGDTFVDFEQGINHAIKELRTALGDDAQSPRFIETLPRRGYRFIAPTERLAAGQLPPGPVPMGVVPPTPVVVAEWRASETAGEKPRLAGWTWKPVAALAGAIAVALLGFLLPRPDGTGDASAVRRLVVRPFTATPGTDQQLSAGLANAISARLGGQQAVPVQLVGGEPRPGERSARPDRGGEQNASHALEGDVTVDGAEISVVARLRDLILDSTIWSERIRVRTDELFSVEDVIAERVVTALSLRLAAAEQDRLRRRYTGNSGAYNEYLRGRAALARYTPEGTVAAIQAFEDALERDSAYALARAGLAIASAEMYLRFAAAAEVEHWGQRAEEEARAALNLDSDLAEAHLARAAVARKREFDWNATISAGRRALALNPNLDQARFYVAGAFYHNGYMQEALIEMEKGRSLQGVDVVEPLRIEALVALFSGDFAPAQARLEEVSRLSSQAIGDTYLALSVLLHGQRRTRANDAPGPGE